MDCHEIGQLLSLYLDGEVEPAQDREVERHLDVCPDCRLHFRELERNRNLLASLPRMGLPDELYGRVMHRVRTGTFSSTSVPKVMAPRGAAWWSGRGFLAAAAAVVLFCLLALTAVGYYAEDHGPPVAARPVIYRHAVDSGAATLGDPPMWSAASYVPGGQGTGR